MKPAKKTVAASRETAKQKPARKCPACRRAVVECPDDHNGDFCPTCRLDRFQVLLRQTGGEEVRDIVGLARQLNFAVQGVFDAGNVFMRGEPQLDKPVLQRLASRTLDAAEELLAGMPLKRGLPIPGAKHRNPKAA